MNKYTEYKNWYLSNFQTFENSLNGEKVLPIHKIRKDAISKFELLDFPTQKDEEWKYTNLSALFKFNFKPDFKKVELNSEQIEKFLFGNTSNNLMVFVNGYFSKNLSKLEKVKDKIIIKNLTDAAEENSDIVEKYFARNANYENQIFTALSTAYTRDGAFVCIPENTVIDEPIHLLYISTENEEPLLIQPRNLIIAEKNSQATLVEHFTSLSNSKYLNNRVSEIVLKENSFIDHIILQEESLEAFHIARMEVAQNRSSRFSSTLISFGAQIARNDFNSEFLDEGCECTLNGLFITSNEQLFDVHTLIDHARPNCNSFEHYKGILDDNSRAVFNGKVIVRKDAQKTNAFQENNNIILSDNALINTKPQLEIFADDVKCSHGATIGQLDTDSLFYLKSRGIGEDKARAILIHAFASDVVKGIKIESIKDYLENILHHKFDKQIGL